MHQLPRLPVADRCPDEDCQVPIGARHQPDCGVAICVSTGHQRRLHDLGAPRPAIDLGDGIVDVHICGEDRWAGIPRGAVEAAAAGLFVYPDTDSRWTPCEPGTPGAVPDLTRVTQTGTWNPIRQIWALPAEVADRG